MQRSVVKFAFLHQSQLLYDSFQLCIQVPILRDKRLANISESFALLADKPRMLQKLGNGIDLTKVMCVVKGFERFADVSGNASSSLFKGAPDKAFPLCHFFRSTC